MLHLSDPVCWRPAQRTRSPLGLAAAPGLSFSLTQKWVCLSDSRAQNDRLEPSLNFSQPLTEAPRARWSMPHSNVQHAVNFTNATWAGLDASGLAVAAG